MQYLYTVHTFIGAKTMNATTSFSTIVNVQIEQHQEDKVFALTSKDLPGFFLAGKDLPVLLQDVPAAISVLYKCNYGMDVLVSPVKDVASSDVADEDWISVPSKFVATPVTAQLS